MIIGIDIMFDDHNKPYLIELNNIPGFLIDIEGNNTLIGHIALKEGKECYQHICIPLKSNSFDNTKVVSGKELYQNSRL